MAWNQPYNPGYSQPPPTGYSAQQRQYGQPPPTSQYGQPPPTSQYGQPPPTSQYGQPPPTSQYGQPPPTSQYGQPPPTSQYGQPPPTSQYGQPPPTSQYGQPPPTSQYGQPPPTSQYGQPPPTSQYGQPPPTSQYGQPPPTSQYGQPPPTSQYGQPPPSAQYGHPGAPQHRGGYGGNTQPFGRQCPPGVSPIVWDWFQAVDKDRSGSINALELREALVNNNWSHFNEETCRILIGMFDGNKDGTIDVHEFEALWKYVQEWRDCFERYDRDRSGKIDSSELHQALTEFGYRLSPDFSHLCTRVFDGQNRNNMNFDDFIQCCVMVRMLTDAFRKKDVQQCGMIQIHYEEFLEMVLDNQVI